MVFAIAVHATCIYGSGNPGSLASRGLGNVRNFWNVASGSSWSRCATTRAFKTVQRISQDCHGSSFRPRFLQAGRFMPQRASASSTTTASIAIPAVPILKQAALHDMKTAVVSPQGSFSYRALLHAASRLSLALIEKVHGENGGEEGKYDLNEGRVAFMCPPSEAYVVAVPLHPGHPDAEVVYVLENSQPDLVVIHEQYADRIPAFVEKVQGSSPLNVVVITDDDVDMRAVVGNLTSEPPDVDDLQQPFDLTRRAMMIYTSGTSGKPKGVVHTHRALQAQITDIVTAWEYTPSDRILHFLPLHHTHGINNKLLCPLWAGATVEFAPNAKAATLWEILANNPARPDDEMLTLFMAVPTVYALLVKELEGMAPEARERCIQGTKDLRLMVSGSAACTVGWGVCVSADTAGPVPLMNKWAALTGHVLLERYGMTELGMVLTNSYRGARHPGFVGMPFPSVRARLVDEEGNGTILLEASYHGVQGRNVDAGVTDEDTTQGLLEIKGDNVFLEYWQRPDATAEEFTHDGWFKTGDVAAYDSSLDAFKICGRASIDIIKSGGYKISALDIERVILEHPSIEQVAVMGLDDDVWGEVIGAIIVWSADTDDDAKTPQALQQWMDGRIAPYKIPRKVLSVPEIPKNAMGKVMKKSLKTMF